MDSPRSPALIENWEWQLAAACRGMDVDAFFHPFDERRPDRQRRIEEAKVVCQGCPVRTQCRDHAMAARELYGIWGGLSEEERAGLLGIRMLRKPRPRPLHSRRRPSSSPREDSGQWAGTAQGRFGLGGTG